MGKTKKFINRKTAVAFEVVHRSQRDPAIADENAPARVLKPIVLANQARVRFSDGKSQVSSNVETQSQFSDEASDGGEVDITLKTNEAEFDFGREFPEDGYDYSQHLREIGGGFFVSAQAPSTVRPLPQEIQLRTEQVIANMPKEVMASEWEEKVGMLNRDAPRGLDLTVDPEVWAALEDPDQFEGDLDDDFVIQAMQPLPEKARTGRRAHGDEDEDVEDEDDEDEYYSDQDSISSGQFSDHSDRASRRSFRRDIAYDVESFMTTDTHPGAASIIDEKFDELIQQYDDDEIGPGTDDHVQGERDISEFQGVLDEFLAEHRRHKPRKDGGSALRYDGTPGVQPQKKPEVEPEGRSAPVPIEQAAVAEDEYSDEVSSSDEEEVEVVTMRRRLQADCESVVSLSTTANRPALITEEPTPKIAISKKSGIPLGVLPTKPRKQRAAPQEQVNKGTARPKNETAEERKLRKQKLKEEKTQRRGQKKQLKAAYKQAEQQIVSRIAQQPQTGLSIFNL